MSLRQNTDRQLNASQVFSYQSECHCAKTNSSDSLSTILFSYQSECHCAKT